MYFICKEFVARAVVRDSLHLLFLEFLKFFSCVDSLWELYTRTEPWSDLEFSWQIVERVKKGERLPVSSTCPFQGILELGWASTPQRRPSFDQLYDQLRELKSTLEQASGVAGSPARSRILGSRHASMDIKNSNNINNNNNNMNFRDISGSSVSSNCGFTPKTLGAEITELLEEEVRGIVLSVVVVAVFVVVVVVAVAYVRNVNLLTHSVLLCVRHTFLGNSSAPFFWMQASGNHHHWHLIVAFFSFVHVHCNYTRTHAVA